MSEFSELLSMYAKKSIYNKIEIANMCGVDRTLLSKVLSGTRKPSSERVVLNIADKMQLSVSEKAELLDKYRMEQDGKNVYYQRKAVYEFIKEFNSIIIEPPRVNSIKLLEHRENNIEHIKSRYNIIGKVCSLIEQSKLEERCNILMYMQPEYKNFISNVVNTGCNEVSIRHLVCLSKDTCKDGKYNVDLLNNLMPLSLMKGKYECRYYYEYANSHINSMQPFSNYILINNTLVMIDYEFKDALFMEDDSVMELFEDKFQQMWNYSKEFIHIQDDINEYLKGFDGMPEMMSPQNKIYSITNTPCVGFFLTKKSVEDMLVKSFPEREALIDMYIKANEAVYNKLTKAGRGVISNYTSKKGLRYFLNTGYLNEYPKSIFETPVSEENRVYLIESLLKMVKTGRYEIYFIKEGYMQLSNNVYIEIMPSGKLTLNRGVESAVQYFQEITEDSIVMAFKDYLNNMPDTEAVLTKEEAVAYIESELENFKVHHNMR